MAASPAAASTPTSCLPPADPVRSPPARTNAFRNPLAPTDACRATHPTPTLSQPAVPQRFFATGHANPFRNRPCANLFRNRPCANLFRNRPPTVATGRQPFQTCDEFFRARSGPSSRLRVATYLIAAPPPQKHEAGPSPAGRLLLLLGATSGEAGPSLGRLHLSSQPPGGLLRPTGRCLIVKCN